MFTSESRPVVFVNTAAGSGRAKRHLKGVREAFATRTAWAQFVETTSGEQLRDMALAAIARGSRILLAMGGDGTAQGLVQAALGYDVVLGIVPVGAGNDFASALGLPEHPAAAARLLLDGETIRVDVAEARTADGKKRIYLGGGGIGLDVAAASVADQHYRGWPRKWRYVAAAVHAYASFKPPRVCVEFPGTELRSIHSEVMVAGVLNTPTYGAGLRLAPEAKVDDGLLDLVLVEHLKLMPFLGLLPRALWTGEIETPRMRRIQTPRVRLTPNRPSAFHGDGEILGPAPVEIEILPRAVQMLAPPCEARKSDGRVSRRAGGN
jgi:YegS/Rv2252/BmrU family lipid kinase